MQLIISKSHDPYFNLALEEFILKYYKEDFFLLYRNKPSVIIGKHQIPYCETDYRFLAKNNILLVRRLSGGGTVYHDLGNLNFCFILNTGNGKQINFRKYTEQVVEFLHKNGIKANFNKRNDILLNGKKISGNAEHIYKDRIIHHGTLLFSSDKSMLKKALTGNKEKYKSNAVESVRSEVCNIKDEIELNINIKEFEILLLKYVANQHTSSKEFKISKNALINDLVKNKYSSFKWNFEYSPKYSFKTNFNTIKGNIAIELDTENTQIKNVKIDSNFLKKNALKTLHNLLLNSFHHPSVLKPLLKDFCNNNSINKEKFVWFLF